MSIIHHSHWEVESQCPHCDNVNHVRVPVGERVVLVECHHCPHNYRYTHIVREHTEVNDD